MLSLYDKLPMRSARSIWQVSSSGGSLAEKHGLPAETLALKRGNIVDGQ